MPSDTNTHKAELESLLRRLNPSIPAGLDAAGCPRIDRKSVSIDHCKTQLYADPRSKILITGPIGVGKSTEMHAIGEHFKNEFSVIHCRLGTQLGAHNVNTVTLNIYLLSECVKAYVNNNLSIPKSLFDEMQRILNPDNKSGDITSHLYNLYEKLFPLAHNETKLLAQALLEYNEKPNTELLSQFLANLVHHAALRYLPNEESLRADPTPIVKLTEECIHDLSHQLNKNIMLIVDDTDRLKDESICSDIFIGRSMALLRLPCALIAAIPFDFYLNHIRDLNDLWSYVGVIDPIPVPPEDDYPSGESQFFQDFGRNIGLDDIISLRNNSRLARLSGGIPRTFVQLCAAVIRTILESGHDHIRDFHIAAIEVSYRDSWRESLLSEDYEILDQVLKKQMDVPRPKMLVREGILLRQRDKEGEIVYAVHPLAKRLLDDYRRRNQIEQKATL